MTASNDSEEGDAVIVVENLDMAYGDFVIQHDLNFVVRQADTYVIMGGSGCGKSTLLRHMIGLKRPARGRVLYGKTSLWETSD
jgi:phospholipid/cholesterol/gamma-HCH transport system ATP-binding protein